MISSSSPEFSLSSSVEGVPGVVESKGPSRSSSSSGTPRRGSRVRKPSSHSFLKGAPAQRAAIPKGRKGSVGGRATWREMMEQQGALEDSHREMEVSGPLNGLEPSAMPSGSGLSSTSRPHMYQDNRQVHHHQTVQNFDDERQVHHHQTVQQYVAAPAMDPAVMASAAEAVTGARTEAAQAVLEARTQVMETHAQFQVQLSQLKSELNARDAALHLAGERERMLNVRLEESLREIETLKANMVHQSASQNATGVFESQIEVRIKLVEEGLGNMRNMFSSLVASRLDSNERNLVEVSSRVDQILNEVIESRERFQDLHAEVQMIKQDSWWANPEGVDGFRSVEVTRKLSVSKGWKPLIYLEMNLLTKSHHAPETLKSHQSG